MLRFTLPLVLVAAPAVAQNWDMPTPYGDSTFHTQNIMQFADEVREATDGEFDITVHSAGSLFPHLAIITAFPGIVTVLPNAMG